MIYCHIHDAHIDTDYIEDCPECIRECDEAFEELTTVELIKSADIRGADPTMWVLASKTISEAGKAAWTMPERDHGVWYVIYASTDMTKVMEDAMDLAKRCGVHHAYAVGCPVISHDEAII